MCLAVASAPPQRIAGIGLLFGSLAVIEYRKA
jgi:hypothetical protein